jgi:hypothetical protein
LLAFNHPSARAKNDSGIDRTFAWLVSQSVAAASVARFVTEKRMI